MIRKIISILLFITGLVNSQDDLFDDIPELLNPLEQDRTMFQKLQDLNVPHGFPTNKKFNLTYLRYYSGLSNQPVFDPLRIRSWIQNSSFNPELFFTSRPITVPILDGWVRFYQEQQQKKTIAETYMNLTRLIYCKIPSAFWKGYIKNQMNSADTFDELFRWKIDGNHLGKSIAVRQTMNTLAVMGNDISESFLNELNTCFDLYVVNPLLHFSFGSQSIPNQRLSALFGLAQYCHVFNVKQTLKDAVTTAIYSSLDENIMLDGGLLEASFNYNLNDIRGFQYLVRLLNLSDYGRLKLLENLSYIQTPTHHFPLVGCTKFNMPVPKPMNLTQSYAMPYSGYFVQRDANRNYLFFYNGRPQRGHKSRGALSIQVFVNNRPFIVSNGPPTYEDYTTIPSPRFFFSEDSTLKLSTVIVDYKSQTWRAPDITVAPDTVVDSHFDTEDDLEYVDGVYTLGYGMNFNFDSSVSHTRAVIFIKPERAWIVLDVMNNTSNIPKKYTQIWNFHPSLTPRNITIRNQSILTPIYNLHHPNASSIKYDLFYNDTIRGYGLQNLHLVAWGFPGAQVPSVNIHVQFNSSSLWTIISNTTFDIQLMGGKPENNDKSFKVFTFEVWASYIVRYKTHAIAINTTKIKENDKWILLLNERAHVYLKNNSQIRVLSKVQPNAEVSRIQKYYKKQAENVNNLVPGLCYAYITRGGRVMDNFFFSEFQANSTTGISANCSSHSIRFPRQRVVGEYIVYRGYIEIEEEDVYNFTSTGTIFILNLRDEYMRPHTPLLLEKGYHSITIVIHYPTSQDKCNFRLNEMPFNTFYRNTRCDWSPTTPTIIENIYD